MKRGSKKPAVKKKEPRIKEKGLNEIEESLHSPGFNFSLTPEEMKSRGIKVGDTVRMGPMDRKYVYTKKGSEGNVVEIEEQKAHVKWHKLTGDKDEKGKPIYNVDKDCLEVLKTAEGEEAEEENKINIFLHYNQEAVDKPEKNFLPVEKSIEKYLKLIFPGRKVNFLEIPYEPCGEHIFHIKKRTDDIEGIHLLYDKKMLDAEGSENFIGFFENIPPDLKNMTKKIVIMQSPIYQKFRDIKNRAEDETKKMINKHFMEVKPENLEEEIDFLEFADKIGEVSEYAKNPALFKKKKSVPYKGIADKYGMPFVAWYSTRGLDLENGKELESVHSVYSLMQEEKDLLDKDDILALSGLFEKLKDNPEEKQKQVKKIKEYAEYLKGK